MSPLVCRSPHPTRPIHEGGIKEFEISDRSKCIDALASSIYRAVRLGDGEACVCVCGRCFGLERRGVRRFLFSTLARSAIALPRAAALEGDPTPLGTPADVRRSTT